jgi:hypothetical protein
MNEGSGPWHAYCIFIKPIRRKKRIENSMIKITIGGGEKGKEHITKGRGLSGIPLEAWKGLICVRRHSS